MLVKITPRSLQLEGWDIEYVAINAVSMKLLTLCFSSNSSTIHQIFLTFSTGSTRFSGIKLYHKTPCTNSILNSFFLSLPKLWNCLPIIDLSRPLAETKSKSFWNHFKPILTVKFFVVFITFVLATIVSRLLLPTTIITCNHLAVFIFVFS